MMTKDCILHGNFKQPCLKAAEQGPREDTIFDGDRETGSLFAGQDIGGIDNIPTVQGLVERIIAEAEQAMDSFRGKRIAS